MEFLFFAVPTVTSAILLTVWTKRQIRTALRVRRIKWGM